MKRFVAALALSLTTWVSSGRAAPIPYIWEVRSCEARLEAGLTSLYSNLVTCLGGDGTNPDVLGCFNFSFPMHETFGAKPKFGYPTYLSNMNGYLSCLSYISDSLVVPLTGDYEAFGLCGGVAYDAYLRALQSYRECVADVLKRHPHLSWHVKEPIDIQQNMIFKLPQKSAVTPLTSPVTNSEFPKPGR